MTTDHAPATHAHESGVVVFLIGMTIRRPLRVDLWGPVAAAMPRMLAELGRNRAAADRGEAPDLGFLGADTTLGAHGPLVVQYWRTPEHLQAYAHNTSAAHLPAWRAFNRAVHTHPGAVGIWHETYIADADSIETFYGNGARVGLGKATGTIPLQRRGRTARERLGRTRNSAAVPATAATA